MIIRCLFLSILLWSCAPKATQADEEAVRKVIIEFQEDFSDGAFQRAEAYATSDWNHINPGGGIDIGKEAVLVTVRSVHQTFLKGVTMTTDSMRVRFVRPDVALVTAYHSFSDFKTPDGVLHANERNIKSYVLVKEGGKWLMTLDHHTTIGL